VAYEINRVSPVTPTSLVASALLTRNPRGLAREALLARIDWLVLELQRAGARFASSLDVAYEGGRRPYHVDAIDQAINLFVEGSLLHVHGPASDAIYQTADDRRLALDFYKNNLIHFFVPRALIATALSVADSLRLGVPRAILRDRVEDLARLFKGEFHFRAEGDAEFDDTLAILIETGDLELLGSGDTAVIRAASDASAERVEFLAGLIRNFLESYKIAARALGFLLKGPMLAKDLVKKAMALGDRMYLTGEIQQREAISKPNIENAFSLFRDLGYLSGGDGGPQRVVAGYDTEVALATIEGRFIEYL
jgi:glycerol-3-phosphate O-acyltransferase